MDEMMEAMGFKYAGKIINLIIYGQPVSMKNSRQIVKFGDKPALIKSVTARQYEADVIRQVQTLPRLLEGELCVTMRCYYKTQRPDLDGELLLDCLQGRIFQNDRQVREKHLYHFIDRDCPRVEIEIKERCKR